MNIFNMFPHPKMSTCRVCYSLFVLNPTAIYISTTRSTTPPLTKEKKMCCIGHSRSYDPIDIQRKRHMYVAQLAAEKALALAKARKNYAAEVVVCCCCYCGAEREGKVEE
jgi:hypothetical protein